MRYVIKDHERGHRKPLSNNEKTCKITTYLKESSFKYVKKRGGSKYIRSLIEKDIGDRSVLKL